MNPTFSNSYLWINCEASVIDPKTPPLWDAFADNTTSEAAQEGNAFAWVCRAAINSGRPCAEFAGEHAPNGWPVDETMADHAQTYVDIVQRHGAPAVERDLSLFDGHVRGRPDAYIVTAETTLRIYDGKYGYGIVEPFRNWQLLLGAMATVQDHHTLVSLEIFQPRPHHPIGPHRKWMLNRDELAGYERQARDRVEAIMNGKALVATPNEHCGHCPNATGCHAFAATVYDHYERFRSDRKHKRLTAAELAGELDFLTMAKTLFEARHSAIRAEAHIRLMAGEMLPGWMPRKRYGHRQFTVPPPVVKMLTGIDPSKPGTMSPAELERAGASKDVVKMITEQPFIGTDIERFDERKVEALFKP